MQLQTLAHQLGVPVSDLIRIAEQENLGLLDAESSLDAPTSWALQNAVVLGGTVPIHRPLVAKPVEAATQTFFSPPPRPIKRRASRQRSEFEQAVRRAQTNTGGGWWSGDAGLIAETWQRTLQFEPADVEAWLTAHLMRIKPATAHALRELGVTPAQATMRLRNGKRSDAFHTLAARVERGEITARQAVEELRKAGQTVKPAAWYS